jgi:hypothetical protein
MSPSPAEIQDMVIKSAVRTVKERIAAAEVPRPLTANEDKVLEVGIVAGSNAMLRELDRLGLLKEVW